MRVAFAILALTLTAHAADPDPNWLSAVKGRDATARANAVADLVTRLQGTGMVRLQAVADVQHVAPADFTPALENALVDCARVPGSSDIILGTRFGALEQLARFKVSTANALRLTVRLDPLVEENYIRRLVPRVISASETRDHRVHVALAHYLVEDADPKNHDAIAQALLKLNPTDEQVFEIMAEAAANPKIPLRDRLALLGHMARFPKLFEAEGEQATTPARHVERALLTALKDPQTTEAAAEVLMTHPVQTATSRRGIFQMLHPEWTPRVPGQFGPRL